MSALPDEYVVDEDVEKFNRRFKNEETNRSITFLWLENETEGQWFELDGYEDGTIRSSKTADSIDEVVSFVENRLNSLFKD